MSLNLCAIVTLLTQGRLPHIRPSAHTDVYQICMHVCMWEVRSVGAAAAPLPPEPAVSVATQYKAEGKLTTSSY